MSETDVVPVGGQKMLSAIVAEAWSVPEDTMLAVVRKQLIQVAPQLNREANNSEIVVFLSIHQQYGLNPMLRQLHGWVDKDGRLVTMVGYDGFVDFATNPKRGGKPFIPRYRYSENDAQAEVGYQDKRRTATSWEWIECWAEFEDGRSTDPIRCYFTEWVTAKWKQPRNRHRMKAYCMMVREVRGFGVMDETDFEKYMESAPDDRAAAGTARGIEAVKERLAARSDEGAKLQAQAVDAEVEPVQTPEAERTEPSRMEPEGKAGDGEGMAPRNPGASVQPSPVEPSAPKRGRPAGSKNKPKEGGAAPPADFTPVSATPAPLPPMPDADDRRCYFCNQDASTGDFYALPDGMGTRVYRCPPCKMSMEAAMSPPKAPSAVQAAPPRSGPCSAPGCTEDGCTGECGGCNHLFCDGHLYSGRCQECGEGDQ